MTDKSQEHTPPTWLVSCCKPDAACMFSETASLRSAGQARPPAKVTRWRRETGGHTQSSVPAEHKHADAELAKL